MENDPHSPTPEVTFQTNTKPTNHHSKVHPEPVLCQIF